jgi:hypothetical protein
MKTIFKILLLCPLSRQAVLDTRDPGQKCEETVPDTRDPGQNLTLKLTFKFTCMWLGSAMLSEALPVTHYGIRGWNYTLLHLLELGMPPLDGVKRDIPLSIFLASWKCHYH